MLGLTLDLENSYVYWMVKDVNKALVYRMEALKGSGILKERTLIKELNASPRYIYFLQFELFDMQWDDSWNRFLISDH